MPAGPRSLLLQEPPLDTGTSAHQAGGTSSSRGGTGVPRGTYLSLQFFLQFS